MWPRKKRRAKDTRDLARIQGFRFKVIEIRAFGAKPGTQNPKL